jgi:hypothetical protein
MSDEKVSRFLRANSFSPLFPTHAPLVYVGEFQACCNENEDEEMIEINFIRIMNYPRPFAHRIEQDDVETTKIIEFSLVTSPTTCSTLSRSVYAK